MKRATQSPRGTARAGNRHAMGRLRRRLCAGAVLAIAAVLPVASAFAAASATVVSETGQVTLKVSGKLYKFFKANPGDTLEVYCTGPGVMRLTVRWVWPTKQANTDGAKVTVTLNDLTRSVNFLSMEPDRGQRAHTLGMLQILDFEIPGGEHMFRVKVETDLLGYAAFRVQTNPKVQNPGMPMEPVPPPAPSIPPVAMAAPPPPMQTSQPVAPAPAPTKIQWLPLTVAAAGVALLGAGLAMGLGAKGKSSELKESPHPRAGADDIIASGKSKALTANILYGVGAAGVGTGLVLYEW